MIWNKARECMSRDELAVLQGKRLVELVGYMYHNAGYYKKKMRDLGLEPGDIRGIEDLENLPFTTKEDLIDAYPLGVFAMSNNKIIRYHASDHSTGYAGMETIAGYTQNDIDVWKECMARSVSMAGLGEGDVIQIAYNYGLCTDGISAHYGAEKVGAAVIPTADCRPAALIALMRRMRVTGVVSTSSYLMHVAQMVEHRGLKNSLQLKAAICGGETWTENTREKIQDKLGIKAYDIFGLNELTGLGVACECERQRGMHIQEDFFLAEIVNTNTLLALPGGVRGELVFTTLQKEGIPLIRYRTMSITKINYEKCECGRTMARMDRLDYGTDDILQIRGNSVSVSQIEAALSGLQGIEASYIICIRKEHHLDVVDVFMEDSRMNEALVSGCGTDVKSQAADAVRNVIGVEPNVYYAESEKMKAFRGSFNEGSEMYAGRKVSIVDERKY
ncbi:MAG: phenylacetate--CoA ligase [Lachnospiraceae bacterium]|nr:phenylacetate--CoA ligase [Lachnospiraceae bacterium]